MNSLPQNPFKIPHDSRKENEKGSLTYDNLNAGITAKTTNASIPRKFFSFLVFLYLKEF